MLPEMHATETSPNLNQAQFVASDAEEKWGSEEERRVKRKDERGQRRKQRVEQGREKRERGDERQCGCRS